MYVVSADSVIGVVPDPVTGMTICGVSPRQADSASAALIAKTLERSNFYLWPYGGAMGR